MINLGISIICWNGLCYTKNTIKTLFKTVRTPFYLCIVNNGSTDGTDSFLSALKPRGLCKDIIIINNSSNLGAGFAHNQSFDVLNRFGVEYICFCDNDLHFETPWIESMLLKMTRYNLGAISPLRISKFTTYLNENSRYIFSKIKDSTNPSESLFSFFKTTPEEGFRKIVSENNGGIAIFDRIPASMPAHCLLVRSSIIANIGFAADPNYKYYGTDDIDLCWEIIKQNHSIAIDKDVYVHHFRHKSISDNNLDRKTILKYNNDIFIEKWNLEIQNVLKDTKSYTAQEFDILNYIRCIRQQRKPTIIAAWGCLGKTTFCKKFSNLGIDLDSSLFQWIYQKTPINLEKAKGSSNRIPNPEFPNNYLDKILESLEKFDFVFVTISKELLHAIDGKNLEFEIIYPHNTRKYKILQDAQNRGNSLEFIQKINKILSSDEEIEYLKKNYPDKIYFIEDSEYLEDYIRKKYF